RLDQTGLGLYRPVVAWSRLEDIATHDPCGDFGSRSEIVAHSLVAGTRSTKCQRLWPLHLHSRRYVYQNLPNNRRAASSCIPTPVLPSRILYLPGSTIVLFSMLFSSGAATVSGKFPRVVWTSSSARWGLFSLSHASDSSKTTRTMSSELL